MHLQSQHADGEMGAEIRRHGRKGYAFYSIVIADARAPRDGKFTEKIGTYNPNTNPATVDLNFERALYWVEVGAQPTDTVRNILSDKGVMLMKHLNGGVRKGAFDEAAAQAKFEAWKQNKEQKIDAVRTKTAAEKKAVLEARLDIIISNVSPIFNLFFISIVDLSSEYDITLPPNS